MPLEIVNYPHPTLRFTSRPIKRVDKELRMMAAEMIELMYCHEGVGLAANQVALPLRMFVLNPTGKQGEGEEMVVINPVIQRPKGREPDREGCLSVPGVFGDVIRAKQIQFSGYDLQGTPLNFTCEGFFARVLQHETDHLDGTMFFDRMPEGARKEIDPLLEEFNFEFRSRQAGGTIPSDQSIIKEQAEWLNRYA